MDWIEVRVTTTAEAGEAVAHLLMEEGAGGVVEEASAVRTAYWPDQGDIEARLDRIRRSVAGLARFGLDVGPARVEWRRVAEETWADAWKEHFHPLRIGERIVVRPTWRTYEAKPGDIVIDLDPGMAFGTGSHPTTSLCLLSLEQLVHDGATVYDIGTGSGILAIAAALLGADRVVGCDIDPVAVKVARENVAKNGVQDRVQVVQGDWTGLEPRMANVVVANILADVIIQMAPEAPRLLCPGGSFVASGIIAHRTRDVQKALEAAGFQLLAIHEEGEWAAIVSRLGEAGG